MMYLNPEDVMELRGCITDFAENKEWNVHELLEVLATISFMMRYEVMPKDSE